MLKAIFLVVTDALDCSRLKYYTSKYYKSKFFKKSTFTLQSYLYIKFYIPAEKKKKYG